MDRKKITIIGGTGLVGAKLARLLAVAGHEIVAASPGTGVNSVTGVGLDEVLAGADILVDVSNAMSFDPAEVRAFFDASGRNLIRAAAAAGVKHHVVLSIVGADRMPGNGYFDGKLVQERIATGSGLPYTIVRSAQFFEFLAAITDGYTADGLVRVSGAQFQPIAADDVAANLASIALEPAVNGIVEIAGPERRPFDLTLGRYLKMRGDARRVERDPDADYFGGRVEDLSLVPLGLHRQGKQDLTTWMNAQATPTA